MSLIRLDVSGFRNLSAVRLEQSFSEGFNFIYGNNGSGKTSFLESIYCLSVGRSFRASSMNRVIAEKETKFSIFSQIVTQNQQLLPVGLERYKTGEVKIRVGGQDARSILEITHILPVQLINSSTYSLLDAGPQFRRKYLDWGAFYCSSTFLPTWKRFERALKQRNAALNGQIPRKELQVWTRELIESAHALDQCRRSYIQDLLPLLINTISKLFDCAGLQMDYQAGWDEKISYEAILQESLEKDSRLGYTQLGPHRADIKILINQIPAKDILSRGQQKLFICAMILAQGALLKSATNKRSIYLIDDLPSELDSISRGNLIALLSKQQTQVFVTAVEREIWKEFSDSPSKMFHVEHGNVKEATF